MTEKGRTAISGREGRQKKGRVLFVDDEPSLRQVIELALRDDYVVVTAGDCVSGLSQIETAAFDLVLTDLQLPDGDGISLLQRVKEVAPETSVIVLTARGKRRQERDLHEDKALQGKQDLAATLQFRGVQPQRAACQTAYPRTNATIGFYGL